MYILFRSSLQLPRFQLRPLKGFLADPVHFSRFFSCIASGITEYQGHRQVRRTRCGVDSGQWTPSITTDTKFEGAFLENTLLFDVL